MKKNNKKKFKQKIKVYLEGEFHAGEYSGLYDDEWDMDGPEDENKFSGEGLFFEYKDKEFSSLNEFDEIPYGKYFEVWTEAESGFVKRYVGKFKKIKKPN